MIKSFEAKPFSRHRSFEIAGNSFQLNVLPKNYPQDDFASLISQFGSLFQGVDIEIKVEARKEFPFHVEVRMRDKGTGNKALRLEFDIMSNEIIMDVLIAYRKGAGGKAISALYNLAKYMRMQKIIYFVSSSNEPAKLFYFHTDFGRPDANGRWELELPRIPG